MVRWFPGPSIIMNSLPNSRRVYVHGTAHPSIRVPFREISLAHTKDFDGKIQPNDPVRVYDTSGPWGDEDFSGEVTRGLPASRRDWLLARGDVEEYEGRTVQPADNGYLSGIHAEHPPPKNFPDSAAGRCAPPPAIPSPNSGMPAKAS